MSYLQRIYFDHCLWTAAWAAGAALAIQFLASLGAGGPARAAAVGIAVGFAFGLWSVDREFPGVPPPERWLWAPWLAFAALLLLYVEDTKAGASARVPLLIALAAAVEWLVLRPSGSLSGMNDTLRIALLVAIGAALFGVLWAGESRSATGPGWRTFGLNALTTAGAGLSFATATSTTLGQVTGGLAAALGAVALMGLSRATAPAGKTGVTVATIAYAVLLIVAGLSSDFPRASTLLLAAAWLAPMLPNQGTSNQNLIQLAAAVVPTVAAFFIAKG